MRQPIVTSACLILLLGGSALAADEEKACWDELAQAETLVDQRVEAKALSEGEVEDVNMLLDEADASCTDGNYKKAREALADVNKMITPQASSEAQ